MQSDARVAPSPRVRQVEPVPPHCERSLVAVPSVQSPVQKPARPAGEHSSSAPHSVPVAVQGPPAGDALLVDPQMPPEHDCPVAQRLEQVPQLVMSDEVSVQTVPHIVRGAEQPVEPV